MAETLLSPSTILLYGRVLQDLTFNFVHPNEKNQFAPAPPPPRAGANNFLLEQLRGDGSEENRPSLARIYGFSYEGHYYDLARPAIFLVHGSGADPEEPRPALDARVARAPADADRTGVARQGGSFSEDMRVWSYDKDDFSIRMDVETGPFAQILLDAMLRPDQQQASYSGAEARLRMSGAEARLRMSGAEARLRGNRSD